MDWIFTIMLQGITMHRTVWNTH